MSDPKSPPSAEAQADLVLINVVSRLGCTVAQAREHIARQAQEEAQQPASKSAKSNDEELL